MSESCEFENCVPVAAGSACAERLFDDGIREPRSADAVWINDVRMSTLGPHDLTALDRFLKCSHAVRIRLFLQEHDQKMTRIILGLFWKWVARDHRRPVGSAANIEIRLH